MQKYAVLRNLAPRRRGASPLESLGPRIATASVPEPQIEVHDLKSNQVIDVVKDPQVQSVAPIMPTALIKPMEIGVSAANDAWGIAAVKADVSSCSGDGVVVAILDTGIDTDSSGIRWR